MQRKIEEEMTLDPDSHNRPNVVSDSEYLSVYQVPMTNSLRVDLKLPKYELNETSISATQTFSLILDYETLVKI